MPDSPETIKWYVPTKWLIAFGALTLLGNLFGWLIIHWDHAERTLPRMWNFTAQLWRAPPPAPKVVEAPKPPPAPPSKPTVAPLRNIDDMRDMFRGLPGDKWEPHFNAHMKNRETALVLELSEIENADGGRFKFEGDVTQENWRPTFYVLPRNRADLKRFRPGMRLLIEGDLERYVDTGSGLPDIVIVLRARLTEAKGADGVVTGSIKK